MALQGVTIRYPWVSALFKWPLNCFLSFSAGDDSEEEEEEKDSDDEEEEEEIEDKPEPAPKPVKVLGLLVNPFFLSFSLLYGFVKSNLIPM